MIMPTEVYCGYMAGVLDCDGCLSITSMKGGRYYSPRVQVTQTDRSWLDEFERTWGGEVYPQPRKNKEWALAWKWEIGGESMVKLLNAVYLYLRLKIEQAELLFELQKRIDNRSGRPGKSLTKQELEIRQGLYKRCKLLNRTGPRNDQLELELKPQDQLPLIK